MLPLCCCRVRCCHLRNVGALIIRIRFWGPLYYNHNKEPPKLVQVIKKAPRLPLMMVDKERGAWITMTLMMVLVHPYLPACLPTYLPRYVCMYVCMYVSIHKYINMC